MILHVLARILANLDKYLFRYLQGDAGRRWNRNRCALLGSELQEMLLPVAEKWENQNQNQNEK